MAAAELLPLNVRQENVLDGCRQKTVKNDVTG